MPTYQFEAIDAATGKEIRDTVDAANELEAQATIRSMGYMVTKIKARKGKATKGGAAGGRKPGRTFAIGGVKSKQLTLFTRQLSILQDAGLPILRSLKVLADMQEPGRLKNSLLDVCDEIESGSTLSEAMSKSPKAFDRLYCNMIRAGEAGGALEVILRRLAEFMERSEALRRKVKGALVYPVVVVMVAVGILAYIMISIVPQFKKIFDDFGSELVFDPALANRLRDDHPGDQADPLRPVRLGSLPLEGDHLWAARREKHPLPLNPHPRHTPRLRCADPGGDQHHQRDLGQHDV
jgi:type IV pilus assembly protein PilC